MKIIEVTQGLLMPITNEEADLVSKFREGNSISKSDLDPRETLVANNLVNRDVLLRKNQDGRITYYKKTQT
jgi:hypothetical protein